MNSNPVVRDLYPGGEIVNLLLNSDIVNLPLKTDSGRNRRPNFVTFVVWSALVVLVWSTKS